MPFEELWVQSEDNSRLKTFLYNTQKNIPAIIMCHGFPGKSSGPFSTQVAEELSREYLICCFDFRGHGQSDGRFYDSSITRELEDLSHIVAHVRRNYSPSKLVLLGHSFGAAIATLYAADRPVDALVLLSGEGDLEKGIPIEFNPQQLRELEARGETKVTNWSLEGTIEEKQDLLGRQFLDDMRRYSTVDAARRIGVPVLLVHGTEDEVVPYAHSEEMHHLFRRSELIPVADARHVYNIYTEYPSKVPEMLSHVSAWLRRTL